MRFPHQTYLQSFGLCVFYFLKSACLFKIPNKWFCWKIQILEEEMITVRFVNTFLWQSFCENWDKRHKHWQRVSVSLFVSFPQHKIAKMSHSLGNMVIVVEVNLLVFTNLSCWHDGAMFSIWHRQVVSGWTGSLASPVVRSQIWLDLPNKKGFEMLLSCRTNNKHFFLSSSQNFQNHQHAYALLFNWWYGWKGKCLHGL